MDSTSMMHHCPINSQQEDCSEVKFSLDPKHGSRWFHLDENLHLPIACVCGMNNWAFLKKNSKTAFKFYQSNELQGLPRPLLFNFSYCRRTKGYERKSLLEKIKQKKVIC